MKYTVILDDQMLDGLRDPLSDDLEFQDAINAATPIKGTFQVGDWARHNQPCPGVFGGPCDWATPEEIVRVRGDKVWRATDSDYGVQIKYLERCEPPDDYFGFQVGDWARHRQPCKTLLTCAWKTPRQITRITDGWADTVDGHDGHLEQLEHCEAPTPEPDPYLGFRVGDPVSHKDCGAMDDRHNGLIVKEIFAIGKKFSARCTGGQGETLLYLTDLEHRDVSPPTPVVTRKSTELVVEAERLLHESNRSNLSYDKNTTLNTRATALICLARHYQEQGN